jgi:hypothetical protein
MKNVNNDVNNVNNLNSGEKSGEMKKAEKNGFPIL